MIQEVNKSRFKASMLGLEAGDVIVCNRDKKRLHAVVLERHEERGSLTFKISRFSPIVTLQPHQKFVLWDDLDEKYGWLSDTSGAIILLPEEWETTEKGGAKTLLAKKKPEDMSEKAKAIFFAIKDQSKSLEENAELILKKLGQESPSKESVMLLCFAFKCVAKKVWEL